MTYQRYFSTTILSLAIFGATLTAWAQMPNHSAVPYPAISASGTSSVKRLPETLRVMIALTAKGKTIEEAFANMTSEQKSALEKMEKLGVAKERIRFDNLSIDQSQDDRRQQMQTMIAQRMRQPAGQRPSLPEEINLRCMLVAERPLTGKTVEEILKESYVLKQKIKEADFTPKKAAMTPEEEELMEEMEGMMSRYGDDEPNTDGEPRMLYVANVSEADSQKAYAEAFAEARKQGEFLANAASVKLGPLMQFSGNVVNNQRNMGYSGYSYSRQDYFLMELLNSQNNAGAKLEILSITPDSMEMTFYAQAVFMMEK